jgi:hypothetical protein
MTSLEKAKVLAKFLDCVGCSNYISSKKSALTFDYELGSNEGCYMTIGEYNFRCHSEGSEAEKAYRNAVSLYLTMI